MNVQRRWWFAGGAALVVAIGIAIGALSHKPSADGDAAHAVATPDVALVTARRGTIEERIEAQGRVGPPAGSSAKIAFAQAGIVRVVAVHVGDRVAAGQVVAELERATLAAAVGQASADVRTTGASVPGNSAEQSAAARLALAEVKLQTLERGGPAAMSSEIAATSVARQAALKVDADTAAVARAETLLAAGVVATKDVDAARAQLASDEADRRTADARVATAGTDFTAALKSAQADVASARNDVQSAAGLAAAARARLLTAQIAYANGALTAPADGVVLAILKHPGEAVDPTQPMMEIGPPLGHGVTLTVPADAARRIAVGNPVTLSMMQSTTRAGTTHGSVIAVVPAVDPATQVGTVVVSGAPPDAVPGDAIAASIVVGHAAGVVVPSSAIVQDPQTGRTVVFVRDAHPKDGEAGYRMRTVAVRAANAELTSIASGLAPGERVAARGGYALLAPRS